MYSMLKEERPTQLPSFASDPRNAWPVEWLSKSLRLVMQQILNMSRHLVATLAGLPYMAYLTRLCKYVNTPVLARS